MATANRELSNDSAMSTFTNFLAEPIAKRTLMACLMIGFANGFVSAFVVLRKDALKIGTLSHSLLPGIALAVLIGGLTQWSALAGDFCGADCGAGIDLSFPHFASGSGHGDGCAVCTRRPLRVGC